MRELRGRLPEIIVFHHWAIGADEDDVHFALGSEGSVNMIDPFAEVLTLLDNYGGVRFQLVGKPPGILDVRRREDSPARPTLEGFQRARPEIDCSGRRELADFLGEATFRFLGRFETEDNTGIYSRFRMVRF